MPKIVVKVTCAAAALIFALASPAFAKIGESVSSYIVRHKDLKLRGTTTKGDTVHYNFALLIEEAERQAAPGFGAGLTVSVKQGTIVAESMAVCIGSDNFMGGQLAGAYGLKFASDALGRTVSGDRQAQDRELEVFSRTAQLVLNGTPKEIRYPGNKHKVIMSRGADGNLLIAVVTDTPLPRSYGSQTPTPMVPGKVPSTAADSGNAKSAKKTDANPKSVPLPVVPAKTEVGPKSSEPIRRGPPLLPQ